MPSRSLPTENDLLLEARNLSRRNLQQDVWLLREISVSIVAGDRMAVVGPTGSGKTLLLRALARLDPVDTGEVLWRGELIRDDDIPAFRRQAIYLQQRPGIFDGTVEDNLRQPFNFRSHGHQEFSRQGIVTYLARLGRATSFLDRATRNLSGGEAQIVALLRAIQLQPRVLLLDEPTAALDDESTQAIERLVASWFDEAPSSRAYVWVSHSNDQVGRIASRVVEMSGGLLRSGVEQDEGPAA